VNYEHDTLPPGGPDCDHWRHWARPEIECLPHCDRHYDWETCDDCGREVCFDIDCANGWRWVDGAIVQCYECRDQTLIRWAIEAEIDATAEGTMVVFHTYEEQHA